MNPCVHHKKNLALLAAGVLEAAESCLLEQHLLECPRCREYWRELSEICSEHSLATDSLPLLEVPGDFHGRLVRRIQAQENVLQRPAFSRFFDCFVSSRWKIALAAAAVAVFVTVMLQMGRKVEVPNLVPSIPNSTLVEVAKTDSRPSFLAYRLAANKSLETLDALLARDATKSSGSDGRITASTREQAGLTD